MAANRWNFPDVGLGLGLRTVHYEHILAHKPKVDFFEIITENFMDTGGRPLYVLDQIAEHYPILVHGVSMSVGSTDPLDWDYFTKLKKLAHRVKATWVSDHLCWTGVLGQNAHDLLPVPLTEECLAHVTSRVRQIQDFLGMPVVLENPSSYVEYLSSSMPEHEFLSRLAEDADCGLLLDVNNVYVSAYNHNFNAMDYVNSIDPSRIVYHHVAGHTNMGTHILDTHSDHVIDPVWELYRRCHERTGGRTTLVEWDGNIPSFEIVHAEILKALKYRSPEEQAQYESRLQAATAAARAATPKVEVEETSHLPGAPKAVAHLGHVGSPEAATRGPRA